MAKFSEVLTIVNGRNQKAVENPNGKYPIYGSGGIMGYADRYLCNAETVVVGRKGSINNPIFVETPFWNVDTAFGLVADRTKLLPKYLYYFCVHFDFTRLNTTVTIPSLTKANLLNIELDLPPLSEQWQIADILDKISDLIDKRRQQLETLDTLVKSQFIEMFGDPICIDKDMTLPRLGDVCTLKAGKFVKANDISESAYEDSYPCYGGNGVRGYVPSYNCEGEFPLIGRQGALCGNVQYATGKFHATEHAVVVTPKIAMDRYWLYFLLSELELNRYASGAAQPGLTVNNLEEIRVNIPSIESQRQYSCMAQQADKSKFEIQRSLETLETLKKALMQKYFE